MQTTSADVSKTYARLSSGMRINSASDDPAGMAVATSLNTDARIYSQAVRNANDGVSVMNLAQGGLLSLLGITERLRELALQSANGTLTISQRRSYDAEADALTNEYNRIVESVSFNGRKVLDGSMRDLLLQLGMGANGMLASGIGESLGQNKGIGTVLSQTNYTTAAGTASRSIKIADINGDGNQDMIYGGTSNEMSFAVRLGNGDGSFRAEVSHAGFFSSDVSVVDINNDGKLDIVGIGNGSGQAAIALGNGDGTFLYRSAASFGIGTGNLNSFAVVDFNNDGKLDMVALDDGASGGAGFGVLIGNGDGTFRISMTRVGLAINSNSTVEVGDFNGDGKADIVYNLDYSSDALQIAYGNGDGTFSSGVTLDMGGGDTVGHSVGDLNGDGYEDIIVTSSGANGLRVRLSNGDGTFKATQSYATSATYTEGALADINSDGILDYVSAVYASGQVELRLGNGDGTFKAHNTYNTGLASLFGAAAVADINGDGAAEIFFARNGLTVAQLNQNTEFKSTIETLNLNTRNAALESLSYIEAAAQRITFELAGVGALMSRLSFANNNLAKSRDETLAAASRITDVDMASELAELVRLQVLQQTAPSLLAHSNLQASLVLELLR